MQGSAIKKEYVSPAQLQIDSFALGARIYKDGFRPTFLVALWRGGAPIGCHVHELLKWKGVETDHIAIRTSRYTGVDEVAEDGEVQVHSTSYLTGKLKPGDSILLVDDIWDSGTTIAAFIRTIVDAVEFDVDIRVACIYYKPQKNKFLVKPRYVLYHTDKWIVFPHEVEGMSVMEILAVMGPDVSQIFDSL